MSPIELQRFLAVARLMRRFSWCVGGGTQGRLTSAGQNEKITRVWVLVSESAPGLALYTAPADRHWPTVRPAPGSGRVVAVYFRCAICGTPGLSITRQRPSPEVLNERGTYETEIRMWL